MTATPTDRAPTESTTATSLQTARADRGLKVLVTVLAVVGVVVATLGNDLRVQDWDPQYARVVVERTKALGGTFYENGIFNKGPLELVVHDVSGRVAGYQGHWFGVAFVSALISLALAWAAARSARFSGATPLVASTTAVVAFIHFTFSDADYAGVVYARNLTVAILALWWVMLLAERPWSTSGRRLAAVAAVGALFGLAVQSLLTTVVTGGVLFLATLALLRRWEGWRQWFDLALIGAGVAFAAFLAAPAWYVLRGAFEEFWASWYTYARFMSEGTGRSLGSQFALGWERFYEYHQVRPLVVLMVVAFVGVTLREWSKWESRRRVVFAGAGAWWVASWIELILSQRYSSHYFSVSAVPVMVMAALLVGWLTTRFAVRPVASKSLLAVPVVAVLLAVYLSGPASARTAIERAWTFRGFGAVAAEHERNLGGHARTVRAVLDLVSEAGDPLLAWTNEPWPYLTNDRVAATRFIWRSFLMGQIYLGRTSPAYVLPRTWEWFASDLEQTRPVVFAEVFVDVEPDTPFAEYAERRFTRVYSGPTFSISYRNDIAEQLLSSTSPGVWVPQSPPVGSGWSVDGNSAVYTLGSEPETDRLLVAGSCGRLEGTVTWPHEGERAIAFYFVDRTGATELLHIVLAPDRAVSASDFVVYEETELGDETGDGVDFALVVGGRSAVLIVDDRIVSALRLPPAVDVFVQARADEVHLTDLVTGDPPQGSGCR